MKVWIIEDEETAARRLRKLIKEINEEIEIEASLDSIEATLNYAQNNNTPDLIFMDIHLADGSSFEIFNHVKIEKPIIFTTAYDEYALQAFKVNAIDYLLKPIKRTELEIALEKFNKLKNNQSFDYANLAKLLKKENPGFRFLVKIGQKMKVIELKDAAYFYTKDKITFLITKSGKRYPVDYTLEKLEDIVDQNIFFRINRQFIINFNAIKEMHAYSKSRVKIELNPGTPLETIVSTERSPHFKKWLTGNL